jgi:hypothetical protein
VHRKRHEISDKHGRLCQLNVRIYVAAHIKMKGSVREKETIGFTSKFKQKIQGQSRNLLLALKYHIVQFQLDLLCEFCIIQFSWFLWVLAVKHNNVRFTHDLLQEFSIVTFLWVYILKGKNTYKTAKCTFSGQ